MKKILIGLLCLSTSVIASESNSKSSLKGSYATNNSFNGVYIGGFLGGVTRKIDFSTQSMSSPPDFPAYKKRYNKNGFMIGVYSGYGKLFDNFYIGTEFSIHHDDATKWRHHSIPVNINIRGIDTPVKWNSRTRYNKSMVFGISGRLGVVNDKKILIYVKPGIEISKDKFTWSSVSIITPDGQEHYIRDNLPMTSISKWAVKFSPGIGTEYFFTPNVAGKLEYTYSFGGKNNNLEDRGDSYENVSHISHALKLGLTYKF